MMLKSKLHIKKYRKIRRIHSDVLASMVEYFEKGKCDVNRKLSSAIDDIEKELKGDLRNFKFGFASDDENDMRILYNLFIYKNHPKITSITEEYLNGNRFKNEEKRKMLMAMMDSYVGIFKIVSIDKENAFVELEDINTKKKFNIVDISLSMGLNYEGVRLYNGIITYDDISYGSGINVSFREENKFFQKYLKDHNNKEYSEFIRCLDLYDLCKKEGALSVLHRIK